LYLETFFIIAIPFYYTMKFQLKKQCFSCQHSSIYSTPLPKKWNPVTDI